MKSFGFHSAPAAQQTRRVAARQAGAIVLTLVSAFWLAVSTLPASADPDRWRAEGWKTDFSQSTIEFDSIMSGGPPRDGIPPIDDPAFVSVSDASGLDAKEPVMALEIDGETRAYPLRIMIWHEIVNDTLAGRPVAVTYC